MAGVIHGEEYGETGRNDGMAKKMERTDEGWCLKGRAGGGTRLFYRRRREGYEARTKHLP
jgi:hypothetical protein